MAEATSNVEFAHRLHEEGEHHEHNGPPDRRAVWIGIIEAVVLSIVAVATAWSGYQASRWEAVSAQQYSLASRLTVRAESKTALAGQDHLTDLITFNGWVAAEVAGRKGLMDFYERRFRPEYDVAFKAWLKTNPLTNPKAPPGPSFMRQYVLANDSAATKLEEESDAASERAVETREIGDDYVKATVFLATVLFLTALSQRFEILGARIAVVAVAFVMLVLSMYQIFVLPRA
jgi:hypothetical protein